MSGVLEDARTLIGAASATHDRDLRILYCGRARLLLAEALAELTRLQSHLDALEGEMTRTASKVPQ